MTYQNLHDEAKTVCRKKFKALSTYIRKKEHFQINNLNFHLKKLEKKGKLNLMQTKGRNNKD